MVHMHNRIKNILKNGEGLAVEFKEARKQLPENLFETICAFLNTEGGTIWLGVTFQLGSNKGSLFKVLYLLSIF